MSRWILIGLLLLPVSFSSCNKAPEPEPWNVLLVTFDTTRADRIGCYGNEDIETPTLDNLAANGIRFANTMSTNPITAPSHTAIHTGRFPNAHGVRDNGLYKLGDAQVTLAEILKDNGYATAASIGAFPLSSTFGLNQGFDIYDDHLTGEYENHLGARAIPKDRLFFDERKAAQVNEAILPWLDDHAQNPFFLWVHYFDPHQPFEPDPPFNERYADDLYNGEIAYTDAAMGFLLRYIERLGVLENTLVVMTADHGEGLGDHNELTHAVLAYNSTLHVPLIIRPPKGVAPEGKVIEERVGTVDILPTILDLLNISPEQTPGEAITPSSIQGRSLVPTWEGQPQPDRLLYAENLSGALTHGWGELRVLYEGDLKYIHGPRPELFDLDQDPDELNNLYDTRQEDAATLRFKLKEFLKNQSLEGVSSTEVISEEIKEQLAALGYLRASESGGETTIEVLRDDGIPPQDRVGDINDMSAAKHLLYKGQFAQALPYVERLMKAAPDSPTYQELYGSALANLNRLDEAWELLQRMRQRGKVSESFLISISSQRFAAGHTEESLEALEAFVENRPTPKSTWVLSTFYQSLGREEDSAATLRKALELDETYTNARIDLAVHHIRKDRLDLAEKEFQRCLKDDPYNPKAHYNYATFLFQFGSPDAASSHYERAIELRPGYLMARYAFISLKLSQGDLDRANAAFNELKELAPESMETRNAQAMLESDQ